ncbi:MAG TPA: hypothetical protein VFC79_13700 [Tissierellaceae bacterium]|nr:hypothetical protein [Tissierellaceae bacterium]
MFYALLMNYNNYFNRTYKRHNTLEQYIDASEGHILGVDKPYNFSITDGVTMEHVFNVTETEEPNYLLLLEENEARTIVSRWFVIDWTKVRGNQYKGLLRRDLLADNYEKITTSPSFIEKGYVEPTDSAIFNKENMNFNQIKTRETLLKDDSKTAWIVGYIAKDHPALSDKTFTYNPVVDLTISGNHTDWQYANLVDGNEHITINPTSPNNNMRFATRGPLPANIGEFMFNSIGGTYIDDAQTLDYWSVNLNEIRDYRNGDWYSGINWNTCLDKVLLDNPSWSSKDDFDYLNSLVGKTIQFQDGVYTISITENNDTYQNDWSYWASGELYNYLYGILNSALPSGILGVNRYPVAYRLFIKKFRFTLTQVTNVQGTYKYSIPQTTRLLNDAPYKMFCIPYYKDGQYLFQVNDTNHRYTLDNDIMLTWSFNIATELGNSLYDLQILPYCPISNWRGNANVAGIFSIDKSENVDYTTLLDSNNKVVGVCSWCDVSSKEQFLKYPIDIMDYKVENECDMYRLCSPNYASVFEFNPAKNDGVEGYNVRYTYKPYQPFINVAPKFNRLYGKDFKDNRGLILSGDFSLPIVKDAWINYQLQNKNYALAFDRQIENLESNYSWQKKLGIANAITGTLQGGISGAMSGALVGGGVGAAVGGALGTGASLVGGIMDVNMQQNLHNEAIDYTKDNFGYQLQNIQALPNTLNKVSSIISVSKLFPFLEYYTCTNEEKEALQNKLKYNGFTIGRIGKIEDYLNKNTQTYVQGQLIRLEGKFDTHIANEIANEFKKGWYI